MITVTSVEAQNRFGQLLDTVQREPVTITRHGRTVAVILSPQDMQDLRDLQKTRPNRGSALEAYFAKVDAALTPAAQERTDEDVPPMVKDGP